MATLTLTANIEGGDAVTAANDLTFKIYGLADGYTTPIHTTGSHTTDPNVTVSGEFVEIVNVEVGSETVFKITSLDENGNESLKSPAYNYAHIDFTFDGTTIDTGEWTKTNPNPTYATLTQNDQIILQKLIDGNLVVRANNLTSVRKFSSGAFEFDMEIEDGLGSGAAFYLINTSTNNFAGIVADSVNHFIRAFTTDDGESITSVTYGGMVRFRILHDGTNCDFYYNKGAGWVHIGKKPAATGDFYIMLAIGNGTVADGKLYFDNLVISNYVEV